MNDKAEAIKAAEYRYEHAINMGQIAYNAVIDAYNAVIDKDDDEIKVLRAENQRLKRFKRLLAEWDANPEVLETLERIRQASEDGENG